MLAFRIPPTPSLRLPCPRWDRIGALTFCALVWGVATNIIGRL